MPKKLTLLALSVAALVAFVVPAMVQANVQLTDEVEGQKVLLKPGADITATSTDFRTTVRGIQIECNLVTIHYTVGTNGPQHVLLEGGMLAAEGCYLNLGLPMAAVATDATVGDLTLNTWGTGTLNMHLTTDLPLFGVEACDLGGEVHLEADEEPDEIRVKGATLEGSAEGGCPNKVMRIRFAQVLAGEHLT